MVASGPSKGEKGRTEHQKEEGGTRKREVETTIVSPPAAAKRARCWRVNSVTIKIDGRIMKYTQDGEYNCDE